MPTHPTRFRVAALSLVTLFFVARAASSVAHAASAAPVPLPIWPANAPEAKASPAADQPALYPFLPPAGKATGGAVVIVPGVRFTGSNLDTEGPQFARWLNERGIAGLVLRTREKPADASASLADLNRAIRTARARATELKISPRRVALLGFGPGAELAADLVYNHPVAAKPDATDPLEKLSARPDLLALIWGAAPANGPVTGTPSAFLVGSSAPADGMTGMIDLWTKLRARDSGVRVDAHFFPKGDARSGLAVGQLSQGSWPESFYNWARFEGLLTDEPRVPIKGMVYLDGHVLPHGYIVLTPVDSPGAGPIVGRVFNSTAGEAIGSFSVPVQHGPIAGRYKVDVRQNMNRWLSNGFTGGLTRGNSPEQVIFGHYRRLEPTIEDQRSFTKVHPRDAQDYIIEIKPDATANLDLKLEVFSK